MDILLKAPLVVLFCFLTFQASAVEKGFSVSNTKTGVAITEGGKNVCEYQRVNPAPDKKRSRAHYFHPVYNLSGEVITEDFPADHLHHHGVWWAWHQILEGDKKIADGWLFDKVQWDVTKLKHQIDDEGNLILNLSVDWNSPQSELILSETSKVTFHPAKEKYRAIDFDIHLTSDRAIKLGGSENPKGYGGFSVRMICPKDLKFSDSKEEKVANRTAIAGGDWMQFQGTFGKEKSAIAIMRHSDSPNTEKPWILRASRSMQNHAYPGQHAISIQDGMHLKYRLLIHDGSLDSKSVQSIYDDYVK
jgi:hypothetical protein